MIAFHLYSLGLFIGLGVAIPIGPMNLEIIRRNLNWGVSSGISFGAGIVSADMTYLLLLNLGVLMTIVHNKAVMVPVGAVGSLVLMWFAYKTLSMETAKLKAARGKPPALWVQARDGYLLTLTSPFTILFWASMSSQIAVNGSSSHHGIGWMAFGVMTGVTGWMLGFNMALFLMRHRLSDRTIHVLNRAGGLILLAFALFGLWRCFDSI